VQTFSLACFSNLSYSFISIFIEDSSQDEECRNCMKEFTKQVIGYLRKFNFLIIENNKILPT
jgi:hypothetical protein